MAFPSTQVVFQPRQLPWLSGGLVLFALLIFLQVPTPADRGEHNPEAALESAFVFWQTHGYLEPHEHVVAFADRRFDDRSRPVALAAMRELGRRAMPASESEQRAEQARLDVLSLAATSDPSEINPLPADHPLRAYGFTPSSPSAVGAITHVFLHAGWLHFCSIAALFFCLGANAEERWGRSALGLFLTGATLFSVGTHWLLEFESPMSWFGASGPVAALFAVFVLRHRNQAVRWVAPAYRQHSFAFLAFEVPGFIIPAVWIISTLGHTAWLEEIGVRNDLSLSALAGGLAFGVFASALMHVVGFESRYLGEQVETKIRAAGASSVLDQASVATDMGDVDRAFDLLAAEAARKPDDPALIRQFWNVAVSTGQADVAASRVANHIQRLVRKNDLARASALWCELAEQLPNQRLPANDLVSLAPTLLAKHDVEFACAALRQAVNASPSEVGVRLALEIMDLARDVDPFTALLAARRALEFDELHAGKHARVLALIQELDPERANELESEATLETGGEATVEPESVPPFPDPSQEEERSRSDPSLDWESHSAVPLDDVDLVPSEADDEPLPPSSGIEYADPEVTQLPFLHTPPPEIVLMPDAVRDVPHEPDAVDLAALPRFDAIRVVPAVPTELTNDVLYFRLGNGRRAKVAYTQVQALAVAALRDISSKPVVVIDLLLNWNELRDEPLRCIRLRSDQFDPARLIDTAGTPTENLQAFLSELHQRTGALALPDEASARGRPFRAFRFLRGYQRRILKVDC